MELGEYVRKALEEREISAGEAAKRSKGQLSENYIRKIMRGETKNPSIPKLKALANAGELNEEELLTMAGVEYEKPNPWPIKSLLRTMDKITSNPDLTEIVKELIKLDAKELQELRRSLRKKQKKAGD